MTNGEYLPDKQGLLAFMLQDPEFAKVNEDGTLHFNHVKVWDFLHRCDKLNEKLAFLSFFTTGKTP